MQSTTPAVLLPNLASPSFVGIDLLSFTTTPRFKGVKDLSKGWHFLFTSTSNALSIRHGLWFFVDDAHFLLVTKWHDESLKTENDQREILRWRANISEFWSGLTPHRQSDWEILTSNITLELLDRVGLAVTSTSTAKQDQEEIAGITDVDEELKLLPIDLKRTWRQGATGRERTNAAIDRSWALKQLIENVPTDEEIIGELQYCFLMTLTLSNWSCYEHWKRILTLVFTCRTIHRVDFFIHFIAAVRIQIQHVKDAEGGLIDMTDDFLQDLLVRFRKGLTESIENQDIVDELDDLEAYLRDEYGWQFGTFARSGVLQLADGEEVAMDTTAFDEDDEAGEYAPQMVELTSGQRKMLNLEEPNVVHAMEETTVQSDEAEEVMADLEELDERY